MAHGEDCPGSRVKRTKREGSTQIDFKFEVPLIVGNESEVEEELTQDAFTRDRET